MDNLLSWQSQCNPPEGTTCFFVAVMELHRHNDEASELHHSNEKASGALRMMKLTLTQQKVVPYPPSDGKSQLYWWKNALKNLHIDSY